MGLSVVGVGQVAAAGVETDYDDVSSLLSEWQELQAMRDETGAVPTNEEQEAMLASWRGMIERRENE